jgi:DNA helicase-2/ATP-dependent DNA helicase PcrA
MPKEGLMQDLNPQQREALMHTNGPLLILAGAGSGKTRLVTHKFAYYVKAQKTPLESLLALTFTNRAADEMKATIRHLTDRDVTNSWIGTMHSQCSRILRKEIKLLNYGTDFSIYDEDDRCSLVRHILKEFKIYEALYKGVSSRITFLKASLIGPEEFLSSGDGFGFDEKLAKVYVRYQDEMKRSNALDYDDLIMLTATLFREQPKILLKYQNLFSHVLVDEFQDLNFAQYQLVKMLSMRDKNICAVGDDDQSICKLRGADVRNILHFENDFPGAKVVRFERNYRSTQSILNVSRAVIALNAGRREKKLWTDRERGEKVHFCWLNNEEEEARHIAKIVKELFLKGAYAYSDIGILYRVTLQSRAIEDALREAGLPYVVVGGISFYQRKEIKDIIAYARLVLNHGDNVSLRRIINCPPRGIGAATISKIESEARKKSSCLFDTLKSCIRGNGIVASTKEKLGNFAHLIGALSTTHGNAADLLRMIVEKTGYTETLDDERKQIINELIVSAEGKDIREFIDRASLYTNMDDPMGEDHVSLMTLHNAKGLEFPVVFISGVEEGILPYFKAIGNSDEIAEERRLFYVGMTRARDLLLLSGARKRRLYSRIQEQEPSRFLKEMPKEYCHWIEKVTEQTPLRCRHEKKKPEPKRVKPLFSSGCRVKHPVWGIGVIRDCYGDGEDQKVMVNFPNIGVKRLSLKLANLTKI